MPEAADISTAGLSNRQLRDEASSLGADCTWCLERSEVVSVYKRAKQVGRGLVLQPEVMQTLAAVPLAVVVNGVQRFVRQQLVTSALRCLLLH